MATRKLSTYRRKRDFTQTAEPSGTLPVKASQQLRFVIQKHAARRLHYDLRLELDGVFKSWAVTRGPSLTPQDKRLAVEVEDHPLDYGDFEGTIPKGQYGGGTVQLWDRGYWEPLGDLSAEEQLRKGELKFALAGERLQGSWVLVRMKGDRDGGKRTNWLLIKHRDEFVRDAAATQKLLDEDASVASGRAMSDIAAGKGRAPKPFMLDTRKLARADAIWNSKESDQARRRSAAKAKPRSRDEAAGLHRARAVQARRAPAERRRLGARGEARRLSHAAARRGTRGDAEDAQGSRLDRQVPADRRRSRRSFPTASSTAKSSRSTRTARRTSRRCRPRCPTATWTTSSSSRSTCCISPATDLRKQPLRERKALLKKLLDRSDCDATSLIRYVDHFEAPATRCWNRRAA